MRAGSWWLALLWFAVLACGMAACASLPLPPVDEPLLAVAMANGNAAEQVARGRQLLVTACAGCHTAVHPMAITMTAWDAALVRMLPQAKLNATDGASIRAYVVAVRQVANTPR